jgi:small-conductance mechanosensitive channel
MASNIANILHENLNIGQIESEIIASSMIIILALISGWIIYSIFKRYLSRWAKETQTKIDDEILRNIKAPIILLALLLGLFYGLDALSYLQPYSGSISAIFSIAQILLTTFIIIRVLNVLTSWFAQRVKRKRKFSEHILHILRQIAKAIVYLFAFFAILSVFNVDLSGLVVGVGVSGIAIALALQNILTDAFGAFTIYFDRPFEVGDFIVLDEFSGTVKKIGIRSTRIQLLQGEELVISNRQLTTASIRNFKKLKKRRVVFKFGVGANTHVEKLKIIPSIVEKIIRKINSVEFDRVHLSELGDFSFNFEVVYYMKNPDYTKYMDIKQIIYLDLIEAFEKEGIVMPYPTQTIFLKKEDTS